MKKCDDCYKTFENDSVFVCELCNKINTCINCVGTCHKMGKTGLDGKYDTLCKSCWQKAAKLIEEHIARNK